jgi:protein phosphatase
VAVWGTNQDNKGKRKGLSLAKLLTAGRTDANKKFCRTHVILRAVGVTKPLEIDIRGIKFHHGDIFLLCSDGLTDMVDDDVLYEVLSTSTALETKVEGLIELAKVVGGQDNITVVMGQIME